MVPSSPLSLIRRVMSCHVTYLNNMPRGRQLVLPKWIKARTHLGEFCQLESRLGFSHEKQSGRVIHIMRRTADAL